EEKNNGEVLNISVQEIMERYLKKQERKGKEEKGKRVRCYYCGKERHTEENCWKKKRNMKGKCYKCGQKGHKVRECYENSIRRWEMEGVLYMMHDHPISAHFGVKATYEKIRERYYWKGIRADVEVHVKSCNKCQRRNKPKGKNELHSIEAKEPFYMVGIDFV